MRLTKGCVLFAAAFIAVMPTSAGAQDGTDVTWRRGQFPAECARRDLQLLTQLEQYGELRDGRAELASEAFWTMMQARQACYTARVSEGLALYDSIQERTLAGRRQ